MLASHKESLECTPMMDRHCLPSQVYTHQKNFFQKVSCVGISTQLTFFVNIKIRSIVYYWLWWEHLTKILQYWAQSGTRTLCSFRLNHKLEHSEKSVQHNNSQQTLTKITLRIKCHWSVTPYRILTEKRKFWSVKRTGNEIFSLS